jgi:dihydropteroate synthase
MAAQLGCPVMLMHLQGQGGVMSAHPAYDDVVAEVTDYLADRAQAAIAAGVERDAIWLDPGIGFGKTAEHSLALMAHLGRVTALGFKTLLGVSRKRFIQTIDPSAETAVDRLGGSLACALIGAEAGVSAVRVHDVRDTVQALKVWAAVRGAL